MADEALIIRFWEFHKSNPNVYELFKRFTFELIQRGHKHYSSDAVIHRIRWHTSLETTGDGFKVNDHYPAFYSRLFHRDYPEHDAFFRKRGSVADGMFSSPDTLSRGNSNAT